MMRKYLIAACVAATIGASSTAGAHRDPNADARRCDTWARSGHTGGHHHSSSSDIALGDPANTVVHGQSGHYVVRNDLGYVEIVGGQSYRGPDPSGNTFPGQGGYVQGEVDAVPGGPDADAHAALFAPDHDHPPTNGDVAGWAQGAYGTACVNAAGQHVAQQTREP